MLMGLGMVCALNFANEAWVIVPEFIPFSGQGMSSGLLLVIGKIFW
jgi:hypothetical protein